MYSSLSNELFIFKRKLDNQLSDQKNIIRYGTVKIRR